MLRWLALSLALLPLSLAAQPRFALVEGVETLWQRPDAAVKGILFIAHGCMHQAPDVFRQTENGRTFEGCAQTKFGQCLGLPEEVSLRDYALSRGYVVMAVSGGTGRQSCWHGHRDVGRVVKAVSHVRREEKLLEAPLIALGASSGGAFVGLLPAASGLGKLTCIVPEIMGVDSEINQGVPTLFIHMPRDHRTAQRVKANLQDLQERKVRVQELRAEARPVADLLGKCLEPSAAQGLLKAFQDQDIVDADGYLRQDPRRRAWVDTARRHVTGDSLVADESCLSEVMNVAWAQHEFTAQFAKEIFDFCEGPGPGSLLEAAPSWQTEFGPMEVFELGKTGPLAIALHGMARGLVHEWDATAKRLAEEGYHVLIPNFHSLANGLRPGEISEEAVARVLSSLMEQTSNKQIHLLLGKSWGGAMACKLSSKLKVQKMVLVAPASLQAWPSQVEVALFWAEDDAAVPLKKAEAKPELLQRLKLFHKEKTGGHRVLDAYIPKILSFAATQEPTELLQTTSEAKRPDGYSLPSFKVLVLICFAVAIPSFFLCRREKHEKRSPRGTVLGAPE